MSEKKRFAVESLSTFAEVHVVYAKDEEEAKKLLLKLIPTHQIGSAKK